jgi:hypothetical protein
MPNGLVTIAEAATEVTRRIFFYHDNKEGLLADDRGIVLVKSVCSRIMIVINADSRQFI